MNEQFKQAVKAAVEKEFPSEAQLLEKVTEAVWIRYQALILRYKRGERCDGWYSVIRFSLLELGAEPRTAHILAHIRSDIEKKVIDVEK